MKNYSIQIFGCSVLLALAAATSQAVTIDWVTVGDTNNVADSNYNGEGTFGAVSYEYKIGKYEVSNAQYVEFLNTVDTTGANSLSLYNASMTSNPNGGINFSAGAASGSKYSSKTGQGSNPVVFVSFFDAMRFVNWLQNGQTSGGTESGVYTIGTGTSETRAPGAVFFLPSENEWYKAAYHQPLALGGPATSYWRYPMRNNTTPYSDQAPGSGSPDASKAGNFYGDDSLANGYNDGFAVTGSTSFNSAQNYLTDVGAYTTASSYYGTFDQGGNVNEFNEAIIGSRRGRSGGSWGDVETVLKTGTRSNITVLAEDSSLGFRVASVPEPAVGGMLLLAGALLFRLRQGFGGQGRRRASH